MSVVSKLLAALGALMLGVVAATVITSSSLLSLLTQATIYAVFALGLGLLLRQNGMVSFGHALYFGAAGYIVSILVATKLVPAEVAVLIAIVGLAVAALAVGLVIVRVPGVAFSMLTLAVGQMAYLTASRSRGLTGGADGMTIELPSTLFGLSTAVLLKPASLLLLCWSMLVLLVLGLSVLLGTRFGAITEAVRDNEERARFIGIRTLLPRAAVYALSAAITALAGVLAALNTGFISPESLHWSLSGVALMMVVVGGTKKLWGPALGAAVYFFAKDILGDHSQHWMAIFGVALIIVIVFAPEGTVGPAGPRAPAPAAAQAAGEAGACTHRAAACAGREPPMSGYVLQTEDVAIHYGGVKAVDGVELTLERGQIRGLIGPNGAGKTTVINAITGRSRLTRGKVTLGGEGRQRAGRGRAPAARPVAVVPAHQHLRPDAGAQAGRAGLVPDGRRRPWRRCRRRAARTGTGRPGRRDRGRPGLW